AAGFFGLAEDDWTPKPQAAALQAYLATFVTSPAAPLAPLTVTATAGDSIAQVSWTVSPAGTPADTYTISAIPGDASPPPAPLTTIAPIQTVIFAGLTDGLSYTFTVVANNPQ